MKIYVSDRNRISDPWLSKPDALHRLTTATDVLLCLKLLQYSEGNAGGLKTLKKKKTSSNIIYQIDYG